MFYFTCDRALTGAFGVGPVSRYAQLKRRDASIQFTGAARASVRQKRCSDTRRRGRTGSVISATADGLPERELSMRSLR